MCSPTYFGVEYVINPWMQHNVGAVDHTVSLSQWTQLYHALSQWADVRLVEPQPRLPDMTFVANAGHIDSDAGIAVVSHFAHGARAGESQHWATWFEGQGLRTIMPPWPFEGQGDLLKDPQGRLWMGHGFRSSVQAHQWLESTLNRSVELLRLVDPRWYHLDTALAPLDQRTVMWYPAAFDQVSQQKIRQSWSRHVELSQADAVNFAANAVVIDQHILLNTVSSGLKSRLTKMGFDVTMLNLDQFLRSGGAAKCLTLTW
jgi:N-dimethylarginine dimethylaminohydrolase